MGSMVIWMLGIGLSVAALVVTAAAKHFYLHMALAAIVSIALAVASYAEVRAATASATSDGQGVAVSLRHMGLVWTWGALGLFATYAFGVLTWREWWQFFIAFVLLAGLSLFLAATVRKDAASGVTDPMLMKVARGFAIFILIAMVITMVGLLIDGKMWRFNTIPGQRPNSQDWGANNFFFFGALALAAIGFHVVKLTNARQAKVV
ncbi:MAG: hypothetical protein AB7L90_09725 [Hyphomicrobiaceae bacterium]